MDKPNTFRSSNFYMSQGDVLHMIIRDETGTAVSMELYSVSDTVNPEDIGYGELTDYDGNVYTTVVIGTQEWIVENLRVTHYADGTAIPEITLDADWLAEDGTAGHDGAWCYYDNDSSYLSDYGLLYNSHAVANTKELCYFERDGAQQTGWRIPARNDWQTLIDYLGGNLVSGAKIKEIGEVYWLTPNAGATNESGFSARGSGFRDSDGAFYSIKSIALWASNTTLSDQYYQPYVEFGSIGFDVSGVNPPKIGVAVRCVRDISSYIPITITVDATPGFEISNAVGYGMIGESTIRVTFMCDAFPVVGGGGFTMLIEDADGNDLFYIDGSVSGAMTAEEGVFFDSNLMSGYETGIPLSRAIVNGDSLTVKCSGSWA